MRSRVIHPRSDPRSGDALIERTRSYLAGEPDVDPTRPDLVCGFLPPGDRLQPTLDAMARAWPESLRLGCEAVTQFADGEMTSGGSLQLFWFEHAGHRAEVIAIGGTLGGSPYDPAIDEVAALVAEGDPVLVLADGLRFPAESFLDRLRERLAAGEGRDEAGDGTGRTRAERGAPWVVGGLASQAEPIAALGARVFLGRDVLEAGCLVVALRGLEMEVEIVRGWDPASPGYTVTAAEDEVLYAIDGEPATDWFRRFFTIGGELAPLPESAYRFPLIVDGPKPERRNLYRSMRRFDEPLGAVTFWGRLEVGDRIRLGMGNDSSLLRTAAALPGGPSAEAVMLYSCVGREAVLGDLAAREVATIHEALGGVSLAGFFSFGEIGPTDVGGPAFYNHTAILALLRERRP